jgi:hypothetical protein
MAESSKIDSVATLAAGYWERHERSISVQADFKIALSGGRAIARLVDLMDLSPKISHEIFAIANIPSVYWHVAADTNLAVLKRRFPDDCDSCSGSTHANPSQSGQLAGRPIVRLRPLGTLPISSGMTAEAISAERDKLLNQDRIKAHIKDFAGCQLVFTGIGTIDDPYLHRFIESIGVPLESIPATVAGDLGYNFVHHTPEVIHETDDLCQRLISVPTSLLQRIAGRSGGKVVAVAWGAKKAKPLLDAYRGGLVNAVIVDTSLAEAMIKNIEEGYLNV